MKLEFLGAMPDTSFLKNGLKDIQLMFCTLNEILLSRVTLEHPKIGLCLSKFVLGMTVDKSMLVLMKECRLKERRAGF